MTDTTDYPSDDGDPTVTEADLEDAQAFVDTFGLPGDRDEEEE